MNETAMILFLHHDDEGVRVWRVPRKDKKQLPYVVIPTQHIPNRWGREKGGEGG